MTEYSLVGFYAPFGKNKAYVYPVFYDHSDTSAIYFQDGTNKTIKAFDAVDYDEINFIRLRNEHIPKSVYSLGSPTVYAFSLCKGRVVWGTKKQIEAFKSASDGMMTDIRFTLLCQRLGITGYSMYPEVTAREYKGYKIVPIDHDGINNIKRARSKAMYRKSAHKRLLQNKARRLTPILDKSSILVARKQMDITSTMAAKFARALRKKPISPKSRMNKSEKKSG